MASPKKTILVIGATGAQGIAVIAALLAPSADGSPSPYAIRALTRDPSSSRAQALAAKGVECVQGAFDDFTSVAKAFDGVYGAWVNTDGFTVGEQKEIFCGLRIFEIAKQTKSMRHYVWSNLDYALKLGNYDPQYRCDHYDGKGRVAEWMQAQASDVTEDGMSWSVVTSGPYMDMLNHGMFGPLNKRADGTYVFPTPIGKGHVAFGRSSENYDPAPIPYRDLELPEKLKFGYYKSDDFVKPSPANQRAVMEVVDALRAAGHECVEFSVPDPGKPMNLFMQLVSSDGNKTLFAPIGQDPKQLELTTISMGPSMFGWLRSLASWIVSTVLGDTIFGNILYGARTRSVDEYWKATEEAREYARMFNREVWEKHEFDGIIAPVQSLPALPHRSVTLIAAICAATVLYNIVESPVGVVPVIRVDADLDELTPEWLNYKVGSGHGSPILEQILYNKTVWSVYNAKKMAGLPVGVQVVGRKWEDEKVIEMMKVVDGALGRRKFGPGNWRPKRN
ncbi:hypothetical protein NM688_g3512 [Phlebia brevispora]|uniref:Uncharacterized protein n=1 Tax=Phlebia brevispora TaxID=194682 RepID=A0ACC1T5P4_9APHY|nr:hypothetical protein NM688_g3512 [Phlebia brevispora]